MTERKRGWYAEADPEAPVPSSAWQPCLQNDHLNVTFDVWFNTEDECLEWIREQVLGIGLMD